MRGIYKRMKITTKSYQLRDGGWMPEARVEYMLLGIIYEQQLRFNIPLPSKQLADANAFRGAISWIDSL